MALSKIPVTNSPQTFQISLAGKDYSLTCKFNSAVEAGWIIALADTNTGVPIADNIPLITGADLLVGLEYLGIGGQLFVYTDGDGLAVPTLDNLGVESNLYFQTEVA